MRVYVYYDKLCCLLYFTKGLHDENDDFVSAVVLKTVLLSALLISRVVLR